MANESTAMYADLQPGTVLFWDSGWSMLIPHFGVITRRTPKTITVAELGITHIGADKYGQHGTAVPKMDVRTGRVYRNRLTRSYPVVDGHYASIWDGNPKQYDFMD